MHTALQTVQSGSASHQLCPARGTHAHLHHGIPHQIQHTGVWHGNRHVSIYQTKHTTTSICWHIIIDDDTRLDPVVVLTPLQGEKVL